MLSVVGIGAYCKTIVNLLLVKGVHYLRLPPFVETTIQSPSAVMTVLKTSKSLPESR